MELPMSGFSRRLACSAEILTLVARAGAFWAAAASVAPAAKITMNERTVRFMRMAGSPCPDYKRLAGAEQGRPAAVRAYWYSAQCLIARSAGFLAARAWTKRSEACRLVRMGIE